MNSSGVVCEDCHLPDKNIISRPSKDVCASCHDASYTGMKADWVKEVKEKSNTISSLIGNIVTDKLSEEGKSKVSYARKLVSLIKTDGSGGIHNYMVLSSLLDKYIKELKQLSTDEK
jgi:hypothetical protein